MWEAHSLAQVRPAKILEKSLRHTTTEQNPAIPSWSYPAASLASVGKISVSAAYRLTGTRIHFSIEQSWLRLKPTSAKLYLGTWVVTKWRKGVELRWHRDGTCKKPNQAMKTNCETACTRTLIVSSLLFLSTYLSLLFPGVVLPPFPSFRFQHCRTHVVLFKYGALPEVGNLLCFISGLLLEPNNPYWDPYGDLDV
jgi:hypothetical protein